MHFNFWPYHSLPDPVCLSFWEWSRSLSATGETPDTNNPKLDASQSTGAEGRYNRLLEMESTAGCMTYSNSQLVLSELGREAKQDSDKDFLLDHTLVRNLNLVLGSSVHLFAKSSKHPEKSV